MTRAKNNSVVNTAEEANRPAAAMAFLAEAMLIGSNAAIGAQEARGQRELAASDVLPVKGTEDAKVWEAMGIKLGDPVKGDSIFREATFPSGWKKEPTDHPMWSNLVDGKGRKRAAIFYKAAFYDRSAHIHLSCRFQATYELENPKTWSGNAFASVKDCGKEIWRGKAIKERTAVAPDFRDHKSDAEQQAKDWLAVNGYPDYRNELAYWD